MNFAPGVPSAVSEGWTLPVGPLVDGFVDLLLLGSLAIVLARWLRVRLDEYRDRVGRGRRHPGALEWEEAGGRAAAPPWPVPFAHLKAIRGPLRECRFEIGREGLRIGRDPVRCQVVLPEATVSREHASIRWQGAGLVVVHRSATNPTYLNGRAVREATLEPGDAVRVGSSIFVVDA